MNFTEEQLQVITAVQIGLEQDLIGVLPAVNKTNGRIVPLLILETEAGRIVLGQLFTPGVDDVSVFQLATSDADEIEGLNFIYHQPHQEKEVIVVEAKPERWWKKILRKLKRA